MTLRSSHNSFTNGEVDPTLLARIDLEGLYRRSARKLRNSLSLWTGAATLRPGTITRGQIVDRTNGNAPITDPTLIKGLIFEQDVDADEVYTVIIRPDTADTTSIDLYLNGVFEQAVGTGGAYPTAEVKNIFFAVGTDRILLLHETIQMRQLRRTAGVGTWALTLLTPSIFPVFDFTTISGTQYRVAGFTFTPGAVTGTGITLTASSPIFTSNHIGGLYIGGGGVFRIDAVATDVLVTGTVITDFSAVTPIEGKLSALFEKMWGDGGGAVPGVARGWPARGTFYLNRLVLGRSQALKNVAAISTAGVFDNFDDSDNDALAGFNISLNASGNQTIQDIVGDDALVFLTGSRVYATNPLIEEPLTVSNFYAPPQVQDSSSEVPAVILDNQIFHTISSKSQVSTLSYETAQGKYLATPATLLSSHLVEQINSNAAWFPPNFTAKLYMATQEDGTMLFYNTLIEQQVSAWSLADTSGKFIQVMGSNEYASVITSRRSSNLAVAATGIIEFAFLSSPDFLAFIDVATSFADATDQPIFTEPDEYVVIGNTENFYGLNWLLNIDASVSVVPTFEFLDSNNQWTPFIPALDSTLGFTGGGDIEWNTTLTPGWGRQTVNGIENKFWIRIRRTEAVVVTTPLVFASRVALVTGLYLEELSTDVYMDGIVETSSDAAGVIAATMSVFAGQQVFAIAEGATYGPFFVLANGTLNIGKEFTSVQIGLQFKPLIVPMPILAATQEGDNLYRERHVQDLFIDFVDSLYIQVDGKNIPVIDLGAYTLGQSVPPQTGIYKITPRLTWEPRQEIKITQAIPGPMTIIGVGYDVEIT